MATETYRDTCLLAITFEDKIHKEDKSKLPRSRQNGQEVIFNGTPAGSTLNNGFGAGTLTVNS